MGWRKAKGANPLGSAELVAGNGQRIRPKRGDVAVDLACRLDGVADHVAAGGMDEVGGRPHRLDHACLVVGGLDGQHDARAGMAGERLRQRREIERAVGIEGDRLDALAEPMTGEDRGMLAGADKQMIETVAVETELWRQRDVEGLRSARGEDHPLAVAADQASDVATRRVEDGPRAATFGVDGRGIAVDVERLRHCRSRGRMKRGRGVMVKIGARRHKRFDPFGDTARRPAARQPTPCRRPAASAWKHLRGGSPRVLEASRLLGRETICTRLAPTMRQGVRIILTV